MEFLPKEVLQPLGHGMDKEASVRNDEFFSLYVGKSICDSIV
jgi:hypothetical protein